MIYSLLDNSVKLSFEINTSLIILFTDEVKFAKVISRFKPPCCIACPTNSLIFKQFGRLIRGVIPYFYEKKINEEELIQILIKHFGQKNIIQETINIIVINAFLDNGKNIYSDKNKNGMYILN